MQDVGFIGMGVMGLGMAKNCAEAGFSMVVHDVNPAAVRALESLGARAAGTPKEVAEASEVIVTVLPATLQVEEVYLGPDGLVAGIRPGAICINSSTISPVTVKKVAAALAAKQAHHLDAGMTACNEPPRRRERSGPGVSKIVAQAEAGTMKLLIGGEPEVFERAKPVLEAMSQEQLYCGPAGSGMVVKLANNMSVAATSLVLFEIFVWAQKNGVGPNTLLHAFKTGASNSNILRGDVEQFALRRRFEPGIFPVDYMYKDFTEAQHAARGTQTPLPIMGLVQQFLEIARAQGLGGMYYPTVLKVVEQLAGGVEIKLEGEQA
jgi:2-hydroxy-3-oxopropionate reductase